MHMHLIQFTPSLSGTGPKRKNNKLKKDTNEEGFGAHGRSREPVRDEIIEMQKLSNEKYKFRSPWPELWTGPNHKIDHFNNALNLVDMSVSAEGEGWWVRW